VTASDHKLALIKIPISIFDLLTGIEHRSGNQASDEKGSPTFSHVECLKELTNAVLDELLEIAKAQIPPLVL